MRFYESDFTVNVCLSAILCCSREKHSEVKCIFYAAAEILSRNNFYDKHNHDLCRSQTENISFLCNCLWISSLLADYFHTFFAYFLTMQLSCNLHLSMDALPDYIQLLDLLYWFQPQNNLQFFLEGFPWLKVWVISFQIWKGSANANV